MSQSTLKSADQRAGSDPEGGRHDLLGSLAAQALNRVILQVRALPPDPDGGAAEHLHAAAIGHDLRGCSVVARALIADGVSTERICDVHIPDVVCRMGEEWVSGDLSFSTVTIGAARLQSLLRELDLHVLNRVEDHAGVAGTVLLVVPPGADHTLGPLLVASQLRRKGFSVRLSLGETCEAVGELVARLRFDAVFLSGAVTEQLPQLVRIVASIRAATPVPPPIVLGGVLVAGGGLPHSEAGDSDAEIRNRTELSTFDHVTCDLDEAMRLCGLAAAR